MVVYNLANDSIGDLSMAMLRKIMMVLAVIILLLFIGSFFLPKEATVERSTVINANTDKVFNYLNSMKNFNDWSPWFEMDPDGKYEFSGADVGVTSKFTWDGENTGKGSQEIIESNPNSEIKLKLIFDGQPPSAVSYKLEPVEDGTKMTWSFNTALNGPLDKYMGLMLDSFLGDMYEKGLSNLKNKVEALPEPAVVHKEKPTTAGHPQIVDVDSQHLIYMANKADFDGDLISNALAESYGAMIAFMAEKEINFAGAPLAITTGGSPEEGFWAFEAALPVDIPVEVKTDNAIQFKLSYSGRAVKVVHTGAYMDMANSYEKAQSYIVNNQLEINGNPWEQYVSDPSVTPESELITHVYFPIK